MPLGKMVSRASRPLKWNGALPISMMDVVYGDACPLQLHPDPMVAGFGCPLLFSSFAFIHSIRKALLLSSDMHAFRPVV